jgi:methionyl aminopeptidase
MMSEDMYQEVRRAAEVHRQTRKHAQEFIKVYPLSSFLSSPSFLSVSPIYSFVQPGMSMIEICEGIEDTTRKLVEENGLAAGIGLIPLFLSSPSSSLI